jgi:hypothetical protein
MPPHARDVIRSRRILGDDSLNASRLGHLEDVQGLGDIERHYARTHLMHMVLPGLRIGKTAVEQHEDRGQRGGATNPVQVVRHG